jgi:hypothetical protein
MIIKVLENTPFWDFDNDSKKGLVTGPGEENSDEP